jgi:hypothetical protein
LQNIVSPILPGTSYWLAALSGEGDVFESQDPEDEQLIRALDRFKPGEIALLTRDAVLLDRNDPRVLSPEQYCRRPAEARPMDFIDLKSRLAEYVGVKHAGSCSSGTDALRTALMV